MHDTQPPLHLLTVFEAAARRQSFKDAADEVHLTPSAISQQIKHLENHLGHALFHRQTRKVVLTEAGHAYFQLAQHTLDYFKTGHKLFSQRFSVSLVRLSVIPFVAYEILIPSLQEFRRLHPEIELRIETSMALVDFNNEPVDAAIRFGVGPWPNLQALPLADCHAALVASPALLKAKPVKSFADLQQHTLIHTRGTHDDWQEVARFLGQKTLEGKDKLIFDCYLAAMNAAINGLGIAIGLLPLSNKWVSSQQLALVAPAVPVEHKHYFVFRGDEYKRALLMKVYAWIRMKFEELAKAGTHE